MGLLRTYSRKAHLSQRVAELEKRYEALGSAVPRLTYVPSPGRKRHLAQAEVDEIVAQYRAGRHSTQLAKEHGLAKETVLKLLRANGVKMRRQGLTSEQIDHAEALYKAGQSLARIGEKFSVDHGTVWHQLRKRGVQMRDPHGRER